ncbi:MAG: branched-chain amino acid ABC transporter permease, partial [Candidatus Marinimicrobia bacterium]|nr:branched-chain amino acid ABC transporter permease [Candidatus Neomarinimicrobiota bacterium]
MNNFKLNTDKQISFQSVGQTSKEYKIHPKTGSVWNKFRLPMSRRHWLKWRTHYNKKNLTKARRLEDKRPLWWFLCLIPLGFSLPWLSNFALSAVAIFCIYASINLLWSLTLGTAGIFSLATMAVVGVSGYVAAAANVYLGIPWPFMFAIGTIAGLIFGGFLALPSSRLDGLYYALLTLGLAEICRVFISQIHALTPTNGSINGVSSFIPEEWYLQRPGLLLGAITALVLLLLSLLIYRLVNGETLGRQLQVAREDEEFAEAIGINYHSARIKVFLISCAGLGFIGAFYAMYFRS